jgi:hypothetical protein
MAFLTRLAALVKSRGVNSTRHHGVFAQNHRVELAGPARPWWGRSGAGQRGRSDPEARREALGATGQAPACRPRSYIKACTVSMLGVAS